MGPLKSPSSPSDPRPRPTSPPRTRPPHDRLPPPPPLPPPPQLPLPPPPPPVSSSAPPLPPPGQAGDTLDLPPPPPLPLPPPPPLSTHPSHRASSSSCRATRTPPRHGTLPRPRRDSGQATAVLALYSPLPNRLARGDHSVEQLVPTRTTLPICGDAPGEDFAGVPTEMLPPKKRLARYHPYRAAPKIQEVASSHGKNRPAPLAGVGGDVGDMGVRRGGDGRRQEHRDDDAGLRAELHRLRISRSSLVLTKLLTPSDRSRDRARLVLPEGLVRASPLLDMMTSGERRLVYGDGGLAVPAFDRLGRSYCMTLKRSHGSYRLTGEWSVFVSQHDMREGDAVEVLAFRPPGWQDRLGRCGDGGLGMALLHCRSARDSWSNNGECDAGGGLLHPDADPAPVARPPRRRRRRRAP